jgi:hypothetical protein
LAGVSANLCHMLADPTGPEGGADGLQGRPSLDKATKLPECNDDEVLVKGFRLPVRRVVNAGGDTLPKLPSDQGGVQITMYPNSGEVTLTPVSTGPPKGKGKDVSSDPDRCKAEGDRRARAMVRRLCTEHRLVYMWTLTYRGEGEHDVERVHRHVERLREKIIRDRNGHLFPYVAVPEPHPGGHGIHVHMAVPFRMKHSKLAKAWGRGHVWCSSFHRRGECRFAEARRAAGYLGKYIGKGFAEVQVGRHRYWRAQGFVVERFICRQRNFDDAEGFAAAVFHWQRYDVWRGNIGDAEIPIRVLRFDGPVPSDD